MAQTFNDFVAECATYEHSREHYDLLKECSEITLMEKYIEDQQFIENVAELTINESVTFTESYFAEAASEEQKEAVKTSVEKKKANVWTKIMNGIKKVINAIISFFKKFAAKLTKTSAEATALHNALKKHNLRQAEYNELGKQLEAAAKRSDIVIERNQKDETKLGISEVKEITAMQYTRYYAVALSSTFVTLGANHKEEAVDAKTLVKVIKKFLKDEKKHDFKTTVNAIENAKNEARSTGIIVYANDKTVKKLADTLTELNSVLDQKMKDMQPTEDLGVAEMNEAWAKINTTVAATIKLYNGYVAYRSLALSTIKKYLDEIKATNQSQKENPTSVEEPIGESAV